MPTFHIEQFGCRATQADGAAIERQLLDRGCSPANSPTAADVVVLNTCTVTAAADAQARDAIRKLHAANPQHASSSLAATRNACPKNLPPSAASRWSLATPTNHKS